MYLAGKRIVEQPLTPRATRKTCNRSQLWFRADAVKVQLDTHLEGDGFSPFLDAYSEGSSGCSFSWAGPTTSFIKHPCLLPPCSSCRSCLLLFYPSSLVDDISLNLIHAQSKPMFLSLSIMRAHSQACQKLYGLHKRQHIRPGIICKWMDVLLISYHYNFDFPTTAWGNFCTSFQTKGISMLLTSHCGKQFVTFHKNDLKRHQQLFLRRLLGACVPAWQLEAKVK